MRLQQGAAVRLLTKRYRRSAMTAQFINMFVAPESQLRVSTGRLYALD
jgi:hypothetical protein